MQVNKISVCCYMRQALILFIRERHITGEIIDIKEA